MNRHTCDLRRLLSFTEVSAAGRFRLRRLIFAIGLALAAPAGALTTQTFGFSGDPILGGDDPLYFPDVTIEFSFDETCIAASCSLDITLTYNDSGGLSTIGQALAGVRFDAFDGATALDLDVSLTSTVTAESVVGAGSDDALTDFGGPPNSDLDVSGHWGFVSGVIIPSTLGSNLLSSVGDAFPGVDALGMADLFDGTISGVEFNPPDGTSFSIVDPNTCTGPPGTPSCGGLSGGFQDAQNRAWLQAEVVAALSYDGTSNPITSIGNVDPIFGTEGRPLVPEPATGLLMGFGLAAMSLARRRS